MRTIKSIIIGLGNPGIQYQHSPHNLGFMFVDILKSTHYTEEIQLTHQKIWFAPEACIIFSKPSTYINCSGKALREIYNSFCKNSVKPNDFMRMITVVHDDVNINMFDVRYKDGFLHAGSGGHNGIRDLVSAGQSIGCDSKYTSAFHRIRLGCANPSSAELHDYVTTKMDQKKIQKWNEIFMDLSTCYQSLYNNNHGCKKC